jgi:hypothetical protein
MVSTVADATLLLIVPKPKKLHFSGGGLVKR